MSVGPFCSFCGEDQYCGELKHLYLRSVRKYEKDLCIKCMFVLNSLDELSERNDTNIMLTSIKEIFNKNEGETK